MRSLQLLLWYLCVFGVILNTICGLESPDESAEKSSSKVKYVIAFIEKQMKLSAIPGLSVSVVSKGQTVINQGFGVKEYGNEDAKVTKDTVFQIGSMSKTFIALGIAKLVDDNKLNWADPVKKVYPEFQVFDKYAEKYTTVHDLLTMNTVFGDHEGDAAWGAGIYQNDQELVDNLQFLETTRQIRPGYAYSNLNYGVLGVIIAHISGRSWSEYLRQNFWQPLGMHSTYSTANNVPVSQLSSGHYVCKGQVLGPFNVANSSMARLTYSAGDLAAGSILSSASDISIFSKFLLNRKPTFQGKQYFKSASILPSMTTGYIKEKLFVDDVAALSGYTFEEEGNTMAAGYGFDVVGPVMHGYRYFDKGGDTNVFKNRNGYIPSEELGVVVLSNMQSVRLDEHKMVMEGIRTFILGTFLNIPHNSLISAYTAIQNKLKLIAQNSSTECDVHYFRNASWSSFGNITLNTKLVGTYYSPVSAKFYQYPQVTVQSNHLHLKYGAIEGPLLPLTDLSYIWGVDISPTTNQIEFTIENGTVIVNLMAQFIKQD